MMAQQALSPLVLGYHTGHLDCGHPPTCSPAVRLATGPCSVGELGTSGSPHEAALLSGIGATQPQVDVSATTCTGGEMKDGQSGR